jgi:hypothetical protein
MVYVDQIYLFYIRFDQSYLFFMRFDQIYFDHIINVKLIFIRCAYSFAIYKFQKNIVNEQL